MKAKDVKFTVDQDTLVGTIFLPKHPNGNGILFFHGWGSSRTGYAERAKAICKLGYTCFTVDLRSFGQSEGNLAELSNSDHLDDVIAAYDFLSGFSQLEQISACGASYGGYLCAMLSQKRRLHSIILRAPGVYPDDMFEKNGYTKEEQLLDEIYRFKTEADFRTSTVMKIVAEFTGSFLVVGSKSDLKIPVKVVESYYDFANSASRRELIWMKDASHDLSTQASKEEFIKILGGWFS